MQTRERAHCARSVFPFIKEKIYKYIYMYVICTHASTYYIHTVCIWVCVRMYVCIYITVYIYGIFILKIISKYLPVG